MNAQTQLKCYLTGTLRMELYLAVALFVSIISPALSFSTGAPQAACQTLSPDPIQHGAQPLMTNITYALNLSTFVDRATGQMVYTPNTTYESKMS